MTRVSSLLKRGRSLPVLTGMLKEFFNDPMFTMSNRDISATVWPDIDIIEDNDQYIIRADIPGVDKNDIDVSVNGDTLTISGEKKESTVSDENGYHHIERSYGTFSRSFNLPEYVEKENITASFNNGVLEMDLKKTGKPKTTAKKIEVT